MPTHQITNEARKILNNIKESQETNGYVTLYSFFISLFELHDTKTEAYRLLSNIVISYDMDDIMSVCMDRNSTAQACGYPNGTYDTIYKPLLDKLSASKNASISSCDIMLELMLSFDDIRDIFSKHGVTPDQIQEMRKPNTESDEHAEEKKEKVKSKPKEKKAPTPTKNIRKKDTTIANNVEKNLTNISYLAEMGDIQPVIGNDDVIGDIFSVLSKKDNNNVVLVGDDGMGKTSTVNHIANIIASDSCPNNFSGKQLMLVDFTKLVSGTMYRGAFEMKLQSIISDAEKKGNYIFFIDDIENMLNSNVKLCEMPNESVIDMFLSNRKICFICTTTPDGYSRYVEPSKCLSRKLTKLTMPEMDRKLIKDIVKSQLEELEDYHKVRYADEMIDKTISLSSKHLTNGKMASCVIDTLDMAGGIISSKSMRSDKTIELMEKIERIDDEIDLLNNSISSTDYDRIDELTREELKLKSQLSMSERDDENNREYREITEKDVETAVSKISGKDIRKADETEKAALIGINDRIRETVIGQDEAVDIVCKAVKRQRVGISNPNKPVVLLFLGVSGVGKSFLSKTLAKELFGDENAMIRLDMSEYSDKMSVNKLYGSAPGYVGYEEGGILTEAIKRKPKSVLLLDEIEKANEEVFNVLLQVFDEGRLTDNKGVLADFKDTIIIMTSNIGASEISASGGTMGFTSAANKTTSDKMRKESIIRNAIKHTFKPEFINRIDRMVWFNELTEESLRMITVNEVRKVGKRANDIGYTLDDEILNGKFINMVMENSKSSKEYGARVIIRNVETMLSDRITDIILEGKIEKGGCIRLEDISDVPCDGVKDCVKL